MFWTFVAPVLLFLLAVPFFLPYSSLRLALRNSRRADGSRSRSRARRELRHAARFIGPTLLLPLLVFVLVEVGGVLFHRHAMPNTTLNDTFGEYFPETSLHAPDLEAWNRAIDEAERKQELEEKEQAEGRAPRRWLTPREALFQHWPMHLVFLLAPATVVLWFLRRYYLPAARAYHDGVRRRHDRYRLRASLR